MKDERGEMLGEREKIKDERGKMREEKGKWEGREESFDTKPYNIIKK